MENESFSTHAFSLFFSKLLFEMPKKTFIPLSAQTLQWTSTPKKIPPSSIFLHLRSVPTQIFYCMLSENLISKTEGPFLLQGMLGLSIARH